MVSISVNYFTEAHMLNRIPMLKVKIKSLAEEARIIRKSEKKNAGRTRELLYLHRVQDVRKEQRASLLAYAFLRGVPYKACEPNPKVKPDWNRVRKLVGKFGTVIPKQVGKQNDDFKAWSEDLNVRELPKYKSHKTVQACRIADIQKDLNGSAIVTPADEGCNPFSVTKEYMAKHDPQIGGYYVRYEDGYASYSPAEPFEAGYVRI
jgi:hypothetical protein